MFGGASEESGDAADAIADEVSWEKGPSAQAPAKLQPLEALDVAPAAAVSAAAVLATAAMADEQGDASQMPGDVAYAFANEALGKPQSVEALAPHRTAPRRTAPKLGPTPRHRWCAAVMFYMWGPPRHRWVGPIWPGAFQSPYS